MLFYLQRWPQNISFAGCQFWRHAKIDFFRLIWYFLYVQFRSVIVSAVSPSKLRSLVLEHRFVIRSWIWKYICHRRIFRVDKCIPHKQLSGFVCLLLITNFLPRSTSSSFTLSGKLLFESSQLMEETSTDLEIRSSWVQELQCLVESPSKPGLESKKLGIV